MAYSIDGLLNGIQNKKKTIVVLEDAIEKERKEITQYRIWIDELEKAGKAMKIAKAGVHLELVSDSPK